MNLSYINVFLFTFYYTLYCHYQIAFHCVIITIKNNENFLNRKSNILCLFVAALIVINLLVLTRFLNSFVCTRTFSPMMDDFDVTEHYTILDLTSHALS